MVPEKSTKYFLRVVIKICLTYLIAVMLFMVFLYVTIALAKNNLERGIFYYSIFMFLLYLYMIYNDVREIATKEKRPQYDLEIKPYKGLIYGLWSIAPAYVFLLVYSLINVPQELLILKKRILQGLFGPIYWLTTFFKGEYVPYYIALLIIPVITALSYYLGLKEIYPYLELKKKLKNKK